MKKVLLVLWVPITVMLIIIVLVQAPAMFFSKFFERIDDFCDDCWEDLYKLRDKILKV